ncbi:MAG TPA: nicotinate-nucleotide adenylyltransferase [Thermoanaerobaculia bacterium]|jgi:nicotinate-nucleotide adenylyltransferase|nr:nicotinate-nucleotide adenylyltransferase [Thermoanaerobaculia bacterium]
MRIGICGGTFDPFHHGHLEPVLAVRDEMQWDRVLYIPAWRQPFKKERRITEGSHRFAMAALAIRDHEALFLSPIELERGGISYSVDTLEALHQQYEGASFDLIIGADNLADLHRWKNPERLFELARFVVLKRGVAGRESGVVDKPSPTPALSPAPDPRHATPSARIIFAPNATIPVSSTEVRERVRAGQSIDAFVDPLVSRYIHHYGLYKEGQP